MASRGGDLETKVLGLLYDVWFSGLSRDLGSRRGMKDYLCDNIDADRNEILKTVEDLIYRRMVGTTFTTDEFLMNGIDRNAILKTVLDLVNRGMGSYDWISLSSTYGISLNGIDKYEESLPPSQTRGRIAQRKQILEILKKIYDQDIYKYTSAEQLTSDMGIKNDDELRDQIHYLSSMDTDYMVPLSARLVELWGQIQYLSGKGLIAVCDITLFYDEDSKIWYSSKNSRDVLYYKDKLFYDEDSEIQPGGEPFDSHRGPGTLWCDSFAVRLSAAGNSQVDMSDI